MKLSKNSVWQESKPLKPQQLYDVYKKMRSAYGHQEWWPGNSPLEVIVGAILTQNTAWINVEKAIRELKKHRALSIKRLRELKTKSLAKMIRSSGYYNMKAKRLKSFISFLDQNYNGSIKKMFLEEDVVLRRRLLEVSGIGPETADSILLYAGEKHFFVIDTYTKRIFMRHKLITPYGKHEDMTYHEWQTLISSHLPQRVPLFNDFHAQIVETAKRHCRASLAECSGCPLEEYL